MGFVYTIEPTSAVVRETESDTDLDLGNLGDRGYFRAAGRSEPDDSEVVGVELCLGGLLVLGVGACCDAVNGEAEVACLRSRERASVGLGCEWY